MISEQYRQKVTQRLRDMIHFCNKDNTRVYAECVLSNIDIDVDDDGAVMYHNVERLIELVDRPTCHNVADQCDGSIFECSECGEVWELTCGGPEDNHLNFCPRCGAKVVTDDD